MKKFVGFLAIILLSSAASAQLISRFTWETNPVTKAAYGPDAISVSSYATVSANGKTGNGLNAGPGQNDINLVLDGTNYNVPAIDISVDFRREESVASFFYRGTYFNFGMNGGSLSVNFLLTSGQAFTAVASGNVFTVPDDHTFHNYRFVYDNNTGVAKILVDSATVYTYNGTAGVPMYWTGAGNVTIGKDMDGTGKNVAILDNLVIQRYANALLPLQLLSLTAEAQHNYAAVNWSTTQEINVTSFTVEKSSNGINFSAVKTEEAKAGYTTINRYAFTDSLPFSPVTYYRLKMINSDGSFSYSEIKSVRMVNVNQSEVSVYPNPTTDYVVIKMNNASPAKFYYTVTSLSGQPISSSSVQLNSGVQQVKVDLTKTNVKGAFIITLTNTQSGTFESFSVIKK